MNPFENEELFPFCARAATALVVVQLLRTLARRLRKRHAAGPAPLGRGASWH